MTKRHIKGSSTEPHLQITVHPVTQDSYHNASLPPFEQIFFVRYPREEKNWKKKIKKGCLFKNIQLRSALSSPLACVGLHFAWSFPKDNACRVNKSRNENSFCSTKNLQAVALYSLFISDTTVNIRYLYIPDFPIHSFFLLYILYDVPGFIPFNYPLQCHVAFSLLTQYSSQLLSFSCACGMLF